MHYVRSLSVSLAVLVLSGVPSAAQKDDEPDRLKRAEQIQKEIAALQKRIEQLQNELASTAVPQGTITRLVFNGFVLDQEPGLCYVPDKDTRIVFVDGQKAKMSDLKLGTHVSVQADEQKVKASDPGQVAARVIVIEKAVRQLFTSGQDADEIAKQVDFTKEYLVLSRIKGVADDRVSVMVSRDKDGPVLRFTYHRGIAKGPDGHILTTLYAISKDARVAEWVEGKKIESAEELSKALRKSDE